MVGWRLAAIVILLAACTIDGRGEEQRDPDEGRMARSDAALGAAITSDRPGCSGAVGVEGEVVWTGARGVADIESGARLTPDTIFDIGRVANQLTAAVVLLLAQEDELRLDDPVSAYLDGLPSWADAITVDNLVHHTTGLPDYVDLLMEQGYEPDDATTQAQAVQAIAAIAELQFAPGSRFRNSGSDYLLLAKIVHAVTGMPLPRVLEQRVFEPLELDMTMDPSAQLPDKAASYRRDLGATYEAIDWAWEQVGDGGVQAAPSELVRWADNFRTGELGGSRLQYAQLADAPRTSLSVSERFEAERYGAGFYIGEEGGLFDVGEWEGFTTALEITADRRVAAAVACNSDWLVPSATATILTLIWSS
ncbi:MAG TPA: serine hydrolase domain-containing protein [Jiangellaceae bacterium]|jgi:CubicO group peptidase (beta-lactamase class C family)|nr:serine hydrolase domain-containing protein [Jiangellaceae bacterium]